VTCLKKAKGSEVSNRIEVKFDSNVLHVNMHQMKETSERLDVIIWRWQPWRHFTKKSAAAWWMHT